MTRSPNDATPRTAATDSVPESVPPTGLVPIAMVTVALKLVPARPSVSAGPTGMAGVRKSPAVPVRGCWRITRTFDPLPPPPPPEMAIPAEVVIRSYGQAAVTNATRATVAAESLTPIVVPRLRPSHDCKRLRTPQEPGLPLCPLLPRHTPRASRCAPRGRRRPQAHRPV